MILLLSKRKKRQTCNNNNNRNMYDDKMIFSPSDIQQKNENKNLVATLAATKGFTINIK